MKQKEPLTFLGYRGATETGATATATALSAASQALGLFELISAILKHVQPAVCCTYTEADDADDAGRSVPVPFNVALIERASAHATLRAAILVNRTWFMAGVPILWRCPSDDALHWDSVQVSARQAFYMSHIRHVNVSKRGALWRAVSHGASDSDEDRGRGDTVGGAARRV
jgi:hypothetical protein